LFNFYLYVMKNILGTIIILVIGSIVLTAVELNTSSPITEYNPIPPRSGGVAAILGQDKTGGPISNGDCTNCHGASNANTTYNLVVRNDNFSVVTSYIAGQTYIMEFTISNGGYSSFGMQAVVLNSSNVQAGNFGGPISTNTQLTSINGAEYLEHNGIASGAGNFTFIVDWIAPANGTGDLTIYGMGMAVNGSGNTQGDQPGFTTSISLPEFVQTSIDYGGQSYCQNDGNISPIILGDQSGTFSSDAGLSIVNGSGVIDISNSSIGNHTITYNYGGSTTTFDIIINQSYIMSETATICEGDSYILGTQTLTSANAGLNTEIFPLANGCDSIVNLTLNVEIIDATVSFNNGVLSANQDGASYQWIDCVNGNVIISDSTNQSFSAGLNGTFAVEITLNGCSEVSECFNVIQANLESQVLNSNYKLYPNPSNEWVSIIGFENIQKIYVVDLFGKKVIEFSELDVIHDISLLPSGSYYVNILHSKGVEQLILIKK
jgi:predicted CXXCH cytochrome family protein